MSNGLLSTSLKCKQYLFTHYVFRPIHRYWVFPFYNRSKCCCQSECDNISLSGLQETKMGTAVSGQIQTDYREYSTSLPSNSTFYTQDTDSVNNGGNDYFERSHEDITCKNFDTQYVPNEFENDPYLLDLYRKAICQGEETDSTVRVNVVGNFAQGKTSLTKRLCMQNTEGVESTNSVEINHCKYEHIDDNVVFYTKDTEEDGNEVINRIVSVAQSEKEKQVYMQADQPQTSYGQGYVFQEPLPEALPSASNANYVNIFFTDETLETHNRDLERSMPMLDTSPELPRNLDKGYVNSIQKKGKKDIGIPTLTRDEQKAFSRLLELNPNKNNISRDLEIWDFGGQYIFYATHTLFHSRRAVYLLVFDLTTPLDKIVRDMEYPDENRDKNMEQYARFWMNSIHTYVGSEDASEPPVILVGTHKDKLKGDERTKQRFKEEYFEKVRELFEDSVMINHIQPADFAVDNTRPEDTDILELRNEIIRVGAKYAKAKTIPARWIPLERALNRIRNEKIISFAKVMEIDTENEFPLKEEEQVKLFLHYHHAKGTLFYFDEEPISAYVVLDAQYLIDAFKCIVTSRRFCRKDPSCRHLWNIFTRQARLETELIEKLWGMDTDNDFLKHKSELLMFLQKHLIISEASVYDEDSKKSEGLGWYVVPSLLRDHSSEDTLKEFLTGRHQSSVRFVMSFCESPLVQVVYHRLLAALIGKWPVVHMASSRKKTLLYENLGVFRLDDSHAGIVEFKHSDIDLRVLSLCPSSYVDHEIADKFRRFSESIVKNEFMKLRSSAIKPENPYTSCFRCNNKKHGLSGGTNKMPLEHIRGKKLEPCPDMKSHEIYPKQALSEWFRDDRVNKLKPDCQLNEKQLSKISQTVGNNWELLGSELGLSDVQLQRIAMDYQTSDMKIYKMLLKWRETKEEGATLNTLLHAMKAVKKVYIEWDEIQNIVDEIECERL
ncbi:uncharacterized protein LOC123557609 isoform X2 [Mercenaria mercenaria]|uniref:uncharacterized protein LOC123557609 isoform X2 n=1 Tax=Mercenaria mercenaria TaxID=6596 RepID=UPI00234E955C|nr:uncharacterized protein LOC123557609 isoform X2 [Mercenaria mercenaria]